jgi:hypothetical protein
MLQNLTTNEKWELDIYTSYFLPEEIKNSKIITYISFATQKLLVKPYK